MLKETVEDIKSLVRNMPEETVESIESLERRLPVKITSKDVHFHGACELDRDTVLKLIKAIEIAERAGHAYREKFKRELIAALEAANLATKQEVLDFIRTWKA